MVLSARTSPHIMAAPLVTATQTRRHTRFVQRNRSWHSACPCIVRTAHYVSMLRNSLTLGLHDSRETSQNANADDMQCSGGDRPSTRRSEVPARPSLGRATRFELFLSETGNCGVPTPSHAPELDPHHPPLSGQDHQPAIPEYGYCGLLSLTTTLL